MCIILVCKWQCLYPQDCILIWLYRTQINYITLQLLRIVDDGMITDGETKRGKRNGLFFVDNRDRSYCSIVLHAQQSYKTWELKWFYSRRGISQNHNRYVPTLAAMTTYHHYLDGIDMWTSGRATYASLNTSGANRRRKNVGCFKTYCILLLNVIKHLIFDSKFITIPKQQCR